MKVIVEATVTPNLWHFTGAVKLRIYANQQFFNSDGQYVPQGTPGQAASAYLEITCAVAGNELTIPSFEIDSTVDGLDNIWSTYTAELVAGGKRKPFLTNFAINTLQPGDPSTTWAEIINLRNLLEPQSMPESLGRQVNALVTTAVGELNKSSETNTGVTALTADPVDPTFPIAVGANDPDYLALLAGSGAIWVNAKENGLAGDGVTDDSAALQTLIDNLSTAELDATIFFPAGIYILAGPLQDVALSNAQIVLPKINKATPMRTLRFLGASPAAQAWPGVGGSVLKSTLAAGNGSVIGVRSNWGSGTSTHIEEAQNNMTFLTFVIENMTVETIANPTISGVDHRFIHRPAMLNSRIVTAGITTGPGSITPDLFAVEPTTATSYGLLTPIDGIPSIAIYENLTIEGFYTGMRWGELVSADNITFGACKVAIEMRGGSHISIAQKLLFVSTGILLQAVGRDPLYTNLTAPNENYLDIQQFDYENNSGLIPWANTTAHIDDPNNYLHGDVKWSSTVFAFVMNGGDNLNPHQSNKPWHYRRPFTNITGVDLDLSNHAVLEVARRIPVSDNTGIAWLALTTRQAGIGHVVGIQTFVNDQIANGSDKRLAQIAGLTDGAINHGALEFYTANGGVLTRRAWFDRFGNFNQTGLSPRGEGGVIASANVIAPTFPVHVVSGTGLIKTITVPNIPANAAVTIALIPSGLWTYDNTDNIGGAGGAAVVGRTMFATWVPSLGKWAMSY